MPFATTFRHSATEPVRGREVDVNFDALALYAESTFLSIAAGTSASGAALTTGLAGTPGMILMYGAASAPSKWLLCDGAAVSRTTYAALFAIVSTSFGVGDGSTTFNVPDYRGIFPKGSGTTARAAGKDASGNFYAGTLGTYSTDVMQGHRHDLNFAGSGLDFIYSGSAGATEANRPLTGTINQLFQLGVGGPRSDGTNGTPRTGHTTEPQSLGINFIIYSGI